MTNIAIYQFTQNRKTHTLPGLPASIRQWNTFGKSSFTSCRCLRRIVLIFGADVLYIVAWPMLLEEKALHDV